MTIQELPHEWQIRLARERAGLIGKVVNTPYKILVYDDNAKRYFEAYRHSVATAWAGFGATFGPTMLIALFWKRSNKQGALAGMIAGAVMVFVWKYLIAPMGGAFAIYELLPAFIIGLVVNVVVSLVTPEPDAKIVKTFEEVKANR